MCGRGFPSLSALSSLRGLNRPQINRLRSVSPTDVGSSGSSLLVVPTRFSPLPTPVWVSRSFRGPSLQQCRLSRGTSLRSQWSRTYTLRPQTKRLEVNEVDILPCDRNWNFQYYVPFSPNLEHFPRLRPRIGRGLWVPPLLPQTTSKCVNKTNKSPTIRPSTGPYTKSLQRDHDTLLIQTYRHTCRKEVEGLGREPTGHDPSGWTRLS